MPAVKKIPLRMCVICREMKPKFDLLRVVNTENGVTVDLSGKLNGRGVYLCKCKQCVMRALNSKKFDKTYGFSLADVKEELEKLIEL